MAEGREVVNNYHCERCCQEDNDRMVQCDKCDMWYHFDCVGVNSAIADASWSCEGCHSGGSAVEIIEAIDPTGNIQRGEPSMNLLTQPQASSSPSTKGETQQKASANIAIVRKSQPSTDVPGPSSELKNNVPAPANKNNTRVMNSVAAKMHQSNASAFSNAPTNSATTCGMSFPFGKSQQQRVPGQPADPFYAQQELQLRMLEEQQRMQQEFIAKKYQILSQMGQSNSSHHISSDNMTSQWNFFSGPTPAQLGARQAIPRDLPHFQGDPEEWPLFISSFETSTSVAGYSHAENLIRLQSCLKGRAKELVKSKLMMPSMVPEIIQTLKMCFGRPEHILERVIEKARKLPPPKDKLEAIIEYALCVKNICSTMEVCKMEAHLNNPMLVKELVDKLSSQYKLNWAMHIKDDRVPIVKTFSEWIFQIAEAASSVVTSTPTTRSATMNTHTESRPQIKVKCYTCDSSEHKISACSEFRNLSLDKKWDMVKKNNLCRQCLNKHRRRCFINNECGIDGCTAKHHRLLHKYTNSQASSSGSNIEMYENNTATINSHSTLEHKQSSLFRILPIRLHKKNGFIDIFAFLDEGSSVTLIEKDVFDLLDVEGVNEPLCLKWTGETTRQEDSSMKASINISNTENGSRFTLKNVHTVQSLELPRQTLNMEEVTKKFPYLAGIPVQSYKNVKPAILIGVDNWKIAVPLKIREGAWNQPIATKTRLGWTIQGCSGDYKQSAWLNIHNCDCEKQYNDLHQMVKEHFIFEDPATKTLVSEEDAKAVGILKTTCRKIDGRYEVGLLWKHNIHKLPESYNNAYNRLICLRRKFCKDTKLKDMLQNQIDNLLSKGYARKLTAEECKGSLGLVWYLPIFIIKNLNKPGKIRMVWDAAAKSNGVCLNDFIHSGPDLLKSLFDVLLSFRVGNIAVCGDIAEMFHQINVRQEDMHSQRFLWWDKGDDTKQPSIYVMRALTFGISCAPCIAHYVRDFNAEQYKEKYPRAVEAIQHYHYVDDFIDSVDNDDHAIELATQVKTIHSSAGFNIRNWSSNSKTVISYLQNDVNQELKPKELAATEKVLGMHWDPNKDSFVYIFRFARLRRNVFTDGISPTKRELLQVLMSIFDPLGFLSCYTTSLKILLQEVWRSDIDWDTELYDSLYIKWKKWKNALGHISTVEVPRCYSPYLRETADVELHTFVDAGEDAFAAVSYLRVVHQGNCTLRIVAGKSKVAPLKPMSIPRLELQAAVVGVRLANKIVNVRRMNIKSQFFWTDSKTVLQWLRMDPRKFQQFVMHRVGEIMETTNVSQWRWVPSKMNPADLATKVQSQWDVSTWFHGPTFLYDEKSEWPSCANLGECSNEEMRHHTFLINKAEKSTTINLNYFSNWRRLYRAVATFLLYMSRIQSRIKKMQPQEGISYEMIKFAKIFLFRQAQESEFQEEIYCLKKGKRLRKDSKLISLNVFIDDEGILRARGRALHLNCHDAIILPTMHRVTFLLVQYEHEGFHHISHETVINNIKSLYYIPKLRVLYKCVRRSCQRCKITSAMPIMPQMASLPPARISSFERPFTFVGIDYFGPINVTVGRRKEKRWGVLFTCLTVRAVHIEIAHSLDTSSCVMCLRNFMARRGTPHEIYTDNGTNFKATSKIFGNESKNLDLGNMASTFDGIKWKFNPPAAPHMGGAWERLVRSVKTTLYQISPNMNFNDETLKNAMAEAEFIINSRPLTFVSLESCDDEALTPNHLLLGSSSGYKPIENKGTDLRLRWRQTQSFSDQFWHRWIKEYMPMLTKRCKWFEKTTPLEVGDIVIVIDENLPRHCWPKGRVINTVVAKDGQVRQVTVKTQCSVFQRPASKIAKLDVGNKEG